MGTKGYHSYRGRSGGGGQAVWIIALVLVLLAAVAFLVSQRYLVYDEDGRPHWELPFGKNAGGEEKPENPISPEDVNIEREEPEEPEKPEEPEEPQEPVVPRRTMEEIHAKEVEYGSLWWKPEYVLSRINEAMMIELKRPNGNITFGTEVELPAGVSVERGVTRDNLITLLGSGKYCVAHITCFSDNLYPKGRPEAALTAVGGQIWYDAGGRTWLDPASEDTLAYISALCQECANLGFREIMLDEFCYPSTGDLDAIAAPEGLDKTATLSGFAAALREALPEDVALSVTLRGSMGQLNGPSGLTAELLSSFDRIYVDGEADMAALQEALPADFDRAGGLAVLTWTKPETGGYVLLS